MKTAEVIMIYEEMVSQWEISHENLFDRNEWLSFPTFREGGLKTLQTDNNVELTHRSKVFVEHFHIPVNNLKHIQFIISAVDSKAEEKACISLVNNLKIKLRFRLYSTLSFFYLQIFVLYKVAHFRFPREDTIIVQTAL